VKVQMAGSKIAAAASGSWKVISGRALNQTSAMSSTGRSSDD
jgi:hypothetical protein